MTTRLDAALAARGLARSRTHAQTLLAEGRVTVDGRGVVKPSTPVADSARIEVALADHYVSRAAHKLIAALDAFGVPVAGRVALDAGASTGGFTQVLRERGARTVIALDVGHGQLATVVREDPGVVVVEGVNARYLTAEGLASASGIDVRPGLVTADLSFISLTQVLPALVATAADGADLVLLVKPQFEVGRSGIREGVVTDPALRADALDAVLWCAHDLGLGIAGAIRSPVVGTNGNVEFLIHVAAGKGGDPSEWRTSVEQWAVGGP